MSSRALRRLQREEEERKRQIQASDKQNEQDESEEEIRLPSRPLNAFDMLNGDDEEEAGNGTANQAGNKPDEGSESDEKPVMAEGNHLAAGTPSKSKKSKKRKGKKKSKASESPANNARAVEESNPTTQLDEIDLALKLLSTNGKDDATKPAGVLIDEGNEQLYRLLAVESKHLNALNEMKRLFGNVVMENEEEGPATPRRRGRGPQHVDLGGALAARNSPVSRGQGLRGLALKRNPLIMGKEEWPQATGGGLGMELVEKLEDGTVEYRFIHNTIYQDVQRQFESCVESMDPQRMIAMLQFNPYHVSTLLQVSEIAKQQGDHSVSGDLLERALFTFGRSLQSSFTNALSEGKARLDFRRPENREFWLAAWRYSNNLGQRGTWRTAYEWAKLILSLDPEGDPYCVAKNLDQLALRGGQSEHYLQLSQHFFFCEDLWKCLPNVHISTSLAQYRLKQPQICRSTLTAAVKSYPWIFTRLFQELNISHIPKSIWGSTARTDRERLDSELYVHNAKDIWSTPEAIAFLAEVVESAPSNTSPPLMDTPISLDEARHVLLSGIPTLINFIPRNFTTMQTTSSDPLAPSENLQSYNLIIPAPSASDRDRELEDEYADLPGARNPASTDDQTDVAADAQELSSMAGLFRRLIPWLGRSTSADANTESEIVAELERAVAEEGMTRAELEQRQARLLQITERAASRTPGPSTRSEARSSTAQAQQQETDDREDSGPSIADDPRNYALDDDDNTNEDVDEETTLDTETLIHPVPSDQSPTTGSPPPASPEPMTDDHLQRYLAGRGLLQLKEYTTRHGADPAKWPQDGTTSSSNEGHALLHEYATKLKQVRNQRTRDFILNYVLPQGTSKEVKTLVEGEL